MKPDILERLLMDRALGRLDPDAEVLLTDYLNNDPAAATQARELEETVRLATEILRSPAPVVEMPTQIHQLVWRHRTERVLALAASFIIGVGLTALVIHANPRRENVAVLNPPTMTKIQTPLVKSQIESLPFWSNQRIYLLASAAANSKENVQ
jgi:anti-sigma factor RsiW